jgi:hypothetical protein
MLAQRIDELITEIQKYLFTAEYRRLDRWVTQLIRDNQEAYGDPSLQGFIHEGVVYKPSNLQIATTAVKRRGLHPSLTEPMEAYLADLKVLTDDKAYIQQSLFRLLDGCSTAQGIRDALPNCLADSLDCIRGLDRRGEEAFTIKDDDRAMRQYLKVLPRIELYATTRMLY